MPISRKPEEKVETNGSSITRTRTRHVISLKDSSSLPTKRTLNLCMHEKTGLSAEMFLIILSITLIFIMIVEFFGVFRPYVKVEALEADLAAAQSALDNKNKQMQDYKDVQDYYNRYNYDGFDRTLADRNDIFDLLERHIMSKGWDARISTLSITGNNVRLTVYGLNSDQVAELFASLNNDRIVSFATVTVTDEPNDGSSYADIEITMRDATTVKPEEEAANE